MCVFSQVIDHCATRTPPPLDSNSAGVCNMNNQKMVNCLLQECKQMLEQPSLIMEDQPKESKKQLFGGEIIMLSIRYKTADHPRLYDHQCAPFFLAVKTSRTQAGCGYRGRQAFYHIIPLNCCPFPFQASVNIDCQEQFSLDKNNVPKDWQYTYI